VGRHKRESEGDVWGTRSEVELSGKMQCTYKNYGSLGSPNFVKAPRARGQCFPSGQISLKVPTTEQAKKGGVTNRHAPGFTKHGTSGFQPLKSATAPSDKGRSVKNSQAQRGLVSKSNTIKKGWVQSTGGKKGPGVNLHRSRIEQRGRNRRGESCGPSQSDLVEVHRPNFGGGFPRIRLTKTPISAGPMKNHFKMENGVCSLLLSISGSLEWFRGSLITLHKRGFY